MALFKQELLRTTNRATFLRYDTGRIENDPSNNSSIVACVFVTAVTFLLTRFPAAMGEYTHRHTDWWEGFMKYAVEMGSGAMIDIPSFIKISSGIRKLIREDTETHRPVGDRISLLLFFQNKGNRGKKCVLFVCDLVLCSNSSATHNRIEYPKFSARNETLRITGVYPTLPRGSPSRALEVNQHPRIKWMRMTSLFTK
jgi:hypothetical protein